MKILLHIPHSSLKLPRRFFKGLKISKEEIIKYNYTMTDYGIDRFFKNLKGKKVKAKYSRLYCDMEKFKDNSKEFMAKYGQGVIYTHTYDGNLFHIHDQKYINKVHKKYDKYHKKLNRTTKKLLNKDKKLLILDLHSFSDEVASYYYEPPFPDVCIGIEPNFYDEVILNEIIKKIEEKGYTWKLNYPYSGSIIPSDFLNGEYEGDIVSIMLEINKRIYQKQ